MIARFLKALARDDDNAFGAAAIVLVPLIVFLAAMVYGG